MRPSPVIDPADSTGALRLLDVRDAESFAAGHAPGAVRVPIENWIAAARRPDGDFAQTGFWQTEIAALGLGPGLRAGIYDDGRMIEAARIWFILQYFGLPAVILNGGWPAVNAAGLTGIEADTGQDGALTLQPGAGPVGLLDRARLKAELSDQTVFDSRTEAEYRGQDLKANRRGGHLPGALLLPHSDLLQDNRLLPPEVLRQKLLAAGFEPGKPITTHCDGGGRAALAAVAAVRAGFEPVSVYYLSFSDWAQDESCPIVTPE